jgi:hypothetical protein
MKFERHLLEGQTRAFSQHLGKAGVSWRLQDDRTKGQVTVPKEGQGKDERENGRFSSTPAHEDGHVLIRRFEFDTMLAMRAFDEAIKSEE